MPAITEPNDILLPAEAARLLRVNESWLRERVRTRCTEKIPHVKIGKHLRFSRRALLVWVEGQSYIPAQKRKAGAR